jgi:hypothetical protein
LVEPSEEEIIRRHVLGIALVAILAVLVFAPSAYAYTALLRPDSDRTSTGWSVVGSASAWGALDDPVTEAETPSEADYITTSASTGYRRVNMSTTKIGGATISKPTVWWYTTTAAAVEVQVYGTGGSAMAKAVASGTGWHSLSFSLNGTQAQVDALYLDFRPSGAAATRSVSAAFIRFSLEPRVLWGSWIDGDVYTTKEEEEKEERKGDAPWTQSTWETFNANAGKNASIVHFGQPAPWWEPFQEAPLKFSREGGALPMMDMDSEEPLEYEEEGEKKFKRVTLAMIAKGDVDSYLEEWAEDVAEYGYPFFFRWNWEMNGAWFDYGDEAIAKPADFITAWQHFHGIAEAKGATNITWVWCPNVTPGKGGETSITTYYPGSAYVDWTCLDGYNHGTNPLGASGWISFSSLYSPSYNVLVSSYPTKPIMIGEVASTESGGSKASWIADMFETQLPTNFPKVKAVVWFNWNINEGKGRWDWQIESSAASKEAFAQALSSPYYSADSFENPTQLAPIQPLP